MIKLIIFDYFGVLQADPLHVWMEKYGFTRDDTPGALSGKFDLGEISADELDKSLGELIGQSAEQVSAEFRKSAVLDRELVEYTSVLKQTFKIALLSNSGGSLRRLLEEFELTEFFDEVIISGEVGHAKPDREIFELLLDRLGVYPEEALFIDDQQKNIDAAEKIGIRGIRFEDIDSLRKSMEGIL